MTYTTLVSQNNLEALPGNCCWKEVVDEKRKQEIQGSGEILKASGQMPANMVFVNSVFSK